MEKTRIRFDPIISVAADQRIVKLSDVVWYFTCGQHFRQPYTDPADGAMFIFASKGDAERVLATMLETHESFHTLDMAITSGILGEIRTRYEISDFKTIAIVEDSD